jgi:hypothetical protein
LDALEDSEEGVLYILYEQVDAFELDQEFVDYCLNNDTMEHTLHTSIGGDSSSKDEEEKQYFKTAEVCSEVLLYLSRSTPDQPNGDTKRAQVDGFYYTSTSDSSLIETSLVIETHLAIEIWKEAQWIRFYSGRSLISSWITSLGTYQD